VWAVVHFTPATKGIDCFYITGRVTVGILYRKNAVHFLAFNKSRKFNSFRPDIRLNTNHNFAENSIPLYYKDQLLNAVYVSNRRLFTGKPQIFSVSKTEIL